MDAGAVGASDSGGAILEAVAGKIEKHIIAMAFAIFEPLIH